LETKINRSDLEVNEQKSKVKSQPEQIHKYESTPTDGTLSKTI